MSKVVALISGYGIADSVERIEVSIAIPEARKIVAHKIWQDRYQDLDAATDEIMDFCKAHKVEEIQQINRLLSMENVSSAKCPHCGEGTVRVPWNDTIARK